MPGGWWWRPARPSWPRRPRTAAGRRPLRAAALARAGEPAVTRDGHRVEVVANVGGPDEVAPALASGAEGVGLLRTEFLFLGRASAPDEEQQREAYGAVADALGGRRLILRTLDAGADKPLAYLGLPPEENPFLGVRGVRLALAHPELLLTQLRAALRVAAERPLSVMFPMVATVQESGGAAGARRGPGRPRPRRLPGARPARGRGHDRGALRGPDGRSPRRGGRLPVHRHQRPDPVHDGRRARQPPARGPARPAGAGRAAPGGARGAAPLARPAGGSASAARRRGTRSPCRC